jgi:hypothetical protein
MIMKKWPVACQPFAVLGVDGILDFNALHSLATECES